MIPKICHLYWDRSPMAFLQVLTVVSFHRYNPDWRIVVYLTKQSYKELGANIFVPDYIGKDYYDLIQRLDYIEIQEIDLNEWGVPLDAHSCQGSDLFRRNVLYKFGGVYSDFDMLWLKPIDLKNVDCIGNPEDFECIVSFYELTHGFHNVSNLIAEKESGFIYSLIQEQKKIRPPYPHQIFGSTMLNLKYPNFESISDKYPRILAIPYETFYPYSTYHMERLFIENDLTPLENKNVLGIHWFNGNSISKEYINKEKCPDCSMTTILKNENYI